MTGYSLIFASRLVLASTIVCLIALGGFLAWAGLAPLAEGVVARGKIEVENQRKVVQHLEGGIIQAILIEEGMHVEAGEALVILADISIASGRDEIALEMANRQVAVARLQALMDGLTGFDLSGFNDLGLDPATVAGIEAYQKDLFTQQMQTLATDIDVLKSRRASLIARGDAAQSEIYNTQRAHAIALADLERNRGLLGKGMVTRTELSRIELNEAELASRLARLRNEQSTARDEAGEVSDQIRQTRDRFREKVSADLVKARAELASYTERFTAVEDVLTRTTIYAPIAGNVLNLAFTTPGGVIKPGESIMEIVPSSRTLIALIEISPTERDGLYENMRVETRISSQHSWRAPQIEGMIESISADLKSSPRGDYKYYEARVVFAEADLNDLEIPILPGMPVEAFVDSGHTRTFLAYLVEPISDTIRRGARE